MPDITNPYSTGEQLKILQEEVGRLKEELSNLRSTQVQDKNNLAKSFNFSGNETVFSAELYRSIAETANESIWVSDTAANTIFVNRRLTELLGYTREEFLGRKAYDFMDEEAQELARLNLNRRISGHSDRYEQKFIHKNGSEIWALVSASPIKGENGDVVASLGMLTDITASKKAELALKESEEKFSLSFHSSPNALALTRVDNAIIIDVNDSFARMFGLLKEEVIGEKSSFLDIFESKEARLKLGEELQNGRRIYNYHTILKRRSGEKINALISIETLHISSGSLSLTTIQDITSLKQIEKNLRTSEERYRQLVESANSIILRWDINGKVLFVNEYGLRFFGYSREEMIGKDSRMLLPEIESSGRSLTSLVEDILEYPENFMNNENENIKKNGERVWITWSNRAITDECGKIIEILAIGNDITSIKNAEHELRAKATEIEAILSCTPNGIMVYDTQARITRSNAAANNFLKMTSADRSLDVYERINKYYKIYNEEGRQLSTEELPVYRAAIKGEIVTNEVILLEGFGLSRWFIFNTAPLFIAGKHFGAVLSMQDITQLQIQNIELIKAKEKAEESDRFKSSFIANISHEIRTPMSSILGFADLLKFPDISGESQAAYIEAIISGGKRMLNIINDLINISKIEAGHVEIRNEATDINKLLDEILVFFLPEATKKGIVLNLNKDLPETNLSVETDRTKLAQIVTNLVKNALKFTASGHVEFGCSLIDGKYLFYVKDTGIGIHKDHFDKVFERFQQCEATQYHMQEGVGLGLPISKAYVEALGGSIWLESVPSKGSVFYFTIPNKAANAIPKSVVYNEIKTQENPPYAEILIADDEESIYSYLSEFLKRRNIKAYHAINGREALNMAKANAGIGLVLMDCRMPLMDGLEATRLIKEFRPQLPIIGLSALANDNDIQAALEAGCNDYIIKPVDLDVLYKKIASFMKSN